MPENVTYWRYAALDGIEFSRVCNSRHSFPKHVHDSYYVVGLMDQGGSYSLGPGREDGFVGAGDIALINPGQVHSGVPAPDVAVTYRMLYFDIGFMQSAARDLDAGRGFFPEFRSVVIHNPILRHKLERACNSMAATTEPLEKESFLFDALSALLSQYAGVRTSSGYERRHPKAVRLAKSYLAADLHEKVTLENLARAVGVSRYHMLRLFKRHTGLSPHQFRTQCRIDLARHLLRRGLPFAQVALETGFTDQSHFTHKFKKFTAATPGQYLASGSTCQAQ